MFIAGCERRCSGGNASRWNWAEMEFFGGVRFSPQSRWFVTNGVSFWAPINGRKYMGLPGVIMALLTTGRGHLVPWEDLRFTLQGPNLSTWKAAGKMMFRCSSFMDMWVPKKVILSPIIMLQWRINSVWKVTTIGDTPILHWTVIGGRVYIFRILFFGGCSFFLGGGWQDCDDNLQQDLTTFFFSHGEPKKKQACLLFMIR